jgi:hypothetical protein
MIGPKSLGVVAVGLYWGVSGPKPNQMVLDEKWCWNPTWHAFGYCHFGLCSIFSSLPFGGEPSENSDSPMVEKNLNC